MKLEQDNCTKCPFRSEEWECRAVTKSSQVINCDTFCLGTIEFLD